MDGCTVNFVVAMRTHAEFGDVGFADRHDAGMAQPFGKNRVFSGHEIFEDQRPARHRKTDDRVELFESERQAMQRPDSVIPDNLPVRLVRQGETFFVRQLGNDGVDLGIEPGDLSEERRHDFTRRNRSAANRSRQFTGAGEAEIPFHHSGNLDSRFFRRQRWRADVLGDQLGIPKFGEFKRARAMAVRFIDVDEQTL